MKRQGKDDLRVMMMMWCLAGLVSWTRGVFGIGGIDVALSLSLSLSLLMEREATC